MCNKNKRCAPFSERISIYGWDLGLAGLWRACEAQIGDFYRLLGDAFEPLNHAEHDCHRNEAYYQEYGPALPEIPCVVHQRTNPQEEVADGCSAEP